MQNGNNQHKAEAKYVKSLHQL